MSSFIELLHNTSDEAQKQAQDMLVEYLNKNPGLMDKFISTHFTNLPEWVNKKMFMDDMRDHIIVSIQDGDLPRYHLDNNGDLRFRILEEYMFLFPVISDLIFDHVIDATNEQIEVSDILDFIIPVSVQKKIGGKRERQDISDELDFKRLKI